MVLPPAHPCAYQKTVGTSEEQLTGQDTEDR